MVMRAQEQLQRTEECKTLETYRAEVFIQTEQIEEIKWYKE